MMKTNTIKPMNALKPLTLAIALVGVTATSALAEDAINADTPTATYSNDWKAPVAIEFDRLDTTGNGLLLPNEASKGKAFNKKTFAQADADRDGYIDLNEYTYHKTGKWPEVAQPVAQSTDPNVAADATVSKSTLSEEPANMAAADTEASGADASSKRSVGVVIDDSIITTKAKAKILGTKELKTLQISVETRQGDVTLSGLVDSEAAKVKAEEVVSGIEGVKSVTNSLEVKS